MVEEAKRDGIGIRFLKVPYDALFLLGLVCETSWLRLDYDLLSLPICVYVTMIIYNALFPCEALACGLSLRVDYCYGATVLLCYGRFRGECA